MLVDFFQLLISPLSFHVFVVALVIFSFPFFDPEKLSLRVYDFWGRNNLILWRHSLDI
jgi:hypothetical protein